MTLKLRFRILFFMLLGTSTTAQTLLKTDSIPLFTIEEDNLSRGRELLKTRGYVSNISNQNGQFDISVFKQYTGYMLLDKATAPKGVGSGKNALPGLAQYGLNDGKITSGKEKVFAINQGFNYKFMDITSLTGGVVTDGNKELSNNEIGGDYSKLLQMIPTALNYAGGQKYVSFLQAKTSGEVNYDKYEAAFEPYIGKYMFTNTPKKSKTFKIKIDPKRPVLLQPDDYHILYLSPLKKGEWQVMEIDTLGVSKMKATINLPENMDFLTKCTVFDQSQKSIFSVGDAQEVAGFDLLFGSAALDYKNGVDYTYLRLSKSGEILYKHTFQQAEEGYVFSTVEMMANTKDALVKLTLRKGLLKGALFHIKINKEGVSYQNKWENDKGVKVITPDGKAASGGASQDYLLVSLDNGEVIFGGRNYGLNGDAIPGDVNALKGYGFTHLDATGKIKNYYNSNCFVPAALINKSPAYHWLNLGEGRLLICSNEARDNMGLAFQPYTLLDLEYSEAFSFQMTKDTEGKDAVKFDKQVISGGQIKTGSKLLDKVANTALGNNTELPKRMFQVNDDAIGYAWAYYIIDTQKEKITRLDMKRSGDYNLSEASSVWYDTEKRELTTFMKTLPKMENINTGRNPYPKTVFLKAITFKF